MITSATCTSAARTCARVYTSTHTHTRRLRDFSYNGDSVLGRSVRAASARKFQLPHGRVHERVFLLTSPRSLFPSLSLSYAYISLAYRHKEYTNKETRLRGWIHRRTRTLPGGLSREHTDNTSPPLRRTIPIVRTRGRCEYIFRGNIEEASSDQPTNHPPTHLPTSSRRR